MSEKKKTAPSIPRLNDDDGKPDEGTAKEFGSNMCSGPQGCTCNYYRAPELQCAAFKAANPPPGPGDFFGAIPPPTPAPAGESAVEALTRHAPEIVTALSAVVDGFRHPRALRFAAHLMTEIAAFVEESDKLRREETVADRTLRNHGL
jgi:hypothetical protein